MLIDHSPISKVQIQTLSIPDPGPLSSPLYDVLRNYLLACQVEGKSPHTLEGYGRRLKQFLAFVKEYELTDPASITSTRIRLFLLSLQARNLNPTTVNVLYRVLRTWFNWLVAEGMIEKTPLANIKPPRIAKTKPRPFSIEDIQKLLLLASGNRFVDVRNQAMVLLFLDTGLRLSEMANIHLADMDFDHEIIRVMGKGSKERVVRMGKRMQRALLKYILRRDDSYDCLWLNNWRQPLSRDGVQSAMKKLCRRAEIRDARLGAHTFRHTAAITFLRNGGGEFMLQYMLGHATLSMTRRYVSELGQDDMIRAHQKASPVDNLSLK